MPAINHNALKMCETLALDVLNLKLNEELVLDFKDNPMTLKRIK